MGVDVVLIFSPSTPGAKYFGEDELTLKTRRARFDTTCQWKKVLIDSESKSEYYDYTYVRDPSSWSAIGAHPNWNKAFAFRTRWSNRYNTVFPDEYTGYSTWPVFRAAIIECLDNCEGTFYIGNDVCGPQKISDIETLIRETDIQFKRTVWNNILLFTGLITEIF